MDNQEYLDFAVFDDITVNELTFSRKFLHSTNKLILGKVPRNFQS